MFYGYRPDGYVVALWATEPTEQERQGLEVLELDRPGSPTDGYWKVENGTLVQLVGTMEQHVARRERIQARRRVTNPDLVRRL